MNRRMQLDVAVVSHHSNAGPLAATLVSLAQAIEQARDRLQRPVALRLVDNSEQGSDAARLTSLLDELQPRIDGQIDATLLVPGRNLGYGGGNNAAFEVLCSRGQDPQAPDAFVLVLNPDVELEPDALAVALDHLRENPGTAMLVPRALDAQGADLHLAHRYPTPLTFLLRAFAHGRLGRTFDPHLVSYEIRDRGADEFHRDTVCASGSFMLLRLAIWCRLRGFDPRYFLYFEDYDLSFRARRLGTIDYQPSVRIRHHGGGAALKGWRHRRLFVSSAIRFFMSHGLRSPGPDS